MVGFPFDYVGVGAIAVAAVLAVVIAYRVVNRRKTSRSMSIGAFPVGWQFYEGLTAGDPPGTVYRFSKKQGKQRVDIIKAPEYPIEIDVCDEEVGNYTHTASMNTFVQFTGLKTARLVGKLDETSELKLEMPGLLRETTRDVNLDPLIEKMINKRDFRFREDEKYYVIRQARKTMEINYRLSQGSLEDVVGKAELREAKLKAKDLTYVRQKQIIRQKFDTYRRVMYNAEEIKLRRDRNGKIMIGR